jgi:predicted RND superfamily exporter protein
MGGRGVTRRHREQTMNFSRLAQAILAHRWRTALVLALVFLGCFSGVHKAVVDFSATAFFAGEGEERIALDTYRDYWGSDDNIAAVLVEGGDETLLNAERLAVIRELSSALRETDAASHVTSITDVPRYRLQFGNPVPWGFLMEVPPEEGPQEAWRAQILANSLLVPMLLSEDGKLAALVVVLPGNVDDVVAVRSIIGQLRETILDFDGREGLRITMSGVPAVRADIGDMILQEQFLFVSIAVVLMATLMMILFRRFYGVVIPLISAMTPCLMVFGIMGWVGEPIGLLNQAYFTLIPVIAIADAIHMVSRFREEFQRKIDAGEPPSVELRDGAIQAALRHIGVACFLTTLTTVVGFCSLMSAEMPVLRSFGLYAGVGVALAYFSVLFFIPLALSLTEPRLTAREEKTSPIDGFLRFCGRITTQRPWACLGGSGLLVILAIWQGSNVIVNNHLTGVLPAGSPTQHANELMDEKLGGVISVRFDLFGDPGSMEDKALLEDMLVLGAKLEALEPVRVVISPASTVAYGATILGGSFAIPSPSNIRRVLRLVESNQTSMRLISPERDRAQIVVQVRDNGANAFKSMVEQIELEIEAAIGKHPIRVVTTGTPFVAYAGINRITTDLRSSLMFAFLAVTILVILLFRSLRVGLLFLPANAVPLVLGYGFMGLMDWPLEPTTGVVFTVALGIAVDDSIHLMVRFREELDNGLSVDHALQESILRCGRAVIVTSIVLACGFFVNTFSSFPYTQALGGLGGFVILSALFCDLLVLPPLLKLFYRSPNRLSTNE